MISDTTASIRHIKSTFGNMTPMGILTGSMAVCQAVDCFGSLLSVLEDLANAPYDIASLQCVLTNTKNAFQGLQYIKSFSPPAGGRFHGLDQSVTASLASVCCLESIVGETLVRGRRGLGEEKLSWTLCCGYGREGRSMQLSNSCETA
jgi:hypothetical protein